MTEASDDWAERSLYDLDTAQAMLDANRYLYVLFCCQQAVEKALKCVISARTGGFPPRIHNLLRLAEETGIEITPEHKRFLGELSAYYIQSRYPEEMATIGSKITVECAAGILKKSREIIQWLFSIAE